MPSTVDVGLVPLILPNAEIHALDIVFIHGLNGHRARSWTNNNSDLWPLWLREDLPGARVWTYGYDAGINLGSKDGIKLHSIRLLGALVEKGVGKSTNPNRSSSLVPLVFVAHSLGGIITKSCITQAHVREQSYSYIFDTTVGVVFLGTPHRGSQWANRLFVAQFSFSLFIATSEFVKVLRSKSSDLATITESFNNIWGARPVLSCYEQSRTLGVGKIVRKEDAITNCQGEIIMGIDSDHHEICKPRSRDTTLYQTILEFLLKCRSERTKSLEALTMGPPIQSSKTLNKEQKRHRNTVRRILWDHIRDQPSPGLDKWTVIRDDWDSDEKAAECRNWLGGAYMCKFPPESGSTIIQIEIDITEEIYPVVWMIQTSAEAEYYPGKHAGRLEFSPGFPIEQLYIVWDTPIFSPFVRFRSGVGQVSSPFDLGNWSPFYTVQHVLQTIANFLTYDPLCRTKPPVNYGVAEIPYKFSTLPSKIEAFAADADKLFHAAQFFSRVYNKVGREVENPVLLESQRQVSITVIRELVSFFCPQGLPQPVGRDDSDYVKAFNKVRTNNDWILEEQIWADTICIACNFEFVVS